MLQSEVYKSKIVAFVVDEAHCAKYIVNYSVQRDILVSKRSMMC